MSNTGFSCTTLKACTGAFPPCFEFQMTEKDFWTKYCRAELLHFKRNARAAAAEAAEDEDLVIFLKDDDILASEARRKVLFLRKLGFPFFFLEQICCITLLIT